MLSTNANGLKFEQTTSLVSALEEAGFSIKEHVVYKNEKEIGMSVPQKQLYTYFLIPNGIYYKDYNSKEWHPDEAFINFGNRTAYIIEKNFKIPLVLWMKNYQVVISKNQNTKSFLHLLVIR